MTGPHSRRMDEIRAAHDAAMIEIDMIRRQMETGLKRMAELLRKAERHVAELEQLRTGAATVTVLQPNKTEP